MSAEISLAFDHPEARAAASAPTEPLDRISVRDYTVAVDIGAFQQERGKPQQIAFNIVVEVAPVRAPLEDDVDRILSYDKIIDAITVELKSARLNLLETLADQIAARILTEPQAQRAFVRIEKLDRGPGALGVEIVRSAKPVTPVEDHAAPHPVLVFVASDAMAAPVLHRAIEHLARPETPLVFCVDHPPEPTPQAHSTMPQRRIDLLALEQNAWRLAALDARLLVVATRTEFDWAFRAGQMTIWAPSKLILDAAERPDVAPDDALALAVWFAQDIDAVELVTLGCEAPKGADLPVRRLQDIV